MNTRRIAYFAAVVPLFTAACADAPEQKPTAPSAAEAVLEPYQCGDVQRIHTLDGVFLASQPSAIDLEHAKKGGIKTVVNLRHHAEIKDFDEPAVVAAQGMSYFNLPWNGPDELTDAVFDRGRELLRTAERPLMMHCSSANRVGPIWLVWRVLDGGKPWDRALAEAVTIGMKTPAYTDKARAYIARQQKKG